MRLIDEQALRSSLEKSERRRAAARSRRRRQARALIWAAVLGVALCAFLVVLSRNRRDAAPTTSDGATTSTMQTADSTGNDAVTGDTAASDTAAGDGPPPLLVVWPQYEGTRIFDRPVRQTVVDSYLAARVVLPLEKSLTVTTPEPQKWALDWSGEGVANEDKQAKWRPAADRSTLTARARAEVSGWARFTQRNRPTFTSTVQGVVPKRIENGLLAVKVFPREDNDLPLWIAPHVVTADEGTVAWKEQAIALLQEAAIKFPADGTAPDARGSTSGAVDGPPSWIIVASLEGRDSRAKPSRDATFAAFGAAYMEGADFPENILRPLRFIAEQAPTANIKLVIRYADLPEDNEAVVRLAFDDSGARDGWVQSGGKVETYEWWQDAESSL